MSGSWRMHRVKCPDCELERDVTHETHRLMVKGRLAGRCRRCAGVASGRNAIKEPMPTAVVLGAVDRWLVARDGEIGPAGGTDDQGVTWSAAQALSERARPGHKPDSVGRTLYRMRNEAKVTSSRVADELVTASQGPQAWYSEPELVELYEALPVPEGSEPETPAELEEWARGVWEGWSPSERREVAGALELLMLDMRGAGDGSNASHRRYADGVTGGKERFTITEGLAIRQGSYGLSSGEKFLRGGAKTERRKRLTREAA